RLDDERVVVLGIVLRREVVDLVTLEAQVMRELVAQVHAGVIRRDRDPHEYDSTPSSASSSSRFVIDPSRRTVSGSLVQSQMGDPLPTGVGPASTEDDTP